jgi:hypothetical protein
MTQTRPYSNSIDHLQDEVLGWLPTRCHLVAVERELAEATTPPTLNLSVVGREEMTSPEELRRRVAQLALGEAKVRAEIDARIEATLATGLELGLTRVCRELGLDQVERATLLMTFVRAVDVSTAEPLEKLSAWGFGDVTPDLVARFCELPFADRIGLRNYYGADGRLVREGLITVVLGRTAYPADWPSCGLKLTNKGFTALTGLQLPGVDWQE